MTKNVGARSTSLSTTKSNEGKKNSEKEAKNVFRRNDTHVSFKQDKESQCILAQLSHTIILSWKLKTGDEDKS